jgi:hypothetical protein
MLRCAPEYLQLVPAASHQELLSAITDLGRVLDRSADEGEVLQLMSGLGLDIPRPGHKSAAELFSEAHAAYTTPVTDADPIASSLIPMREAIRLAIVALLDMRPSTEKTRSEWDKIIPIGSQLKVESIPKERVKTWAVQWGTLLNYDLSPSKSHRLTREELRTRIVRSTLYLKGFLPGLDPSKLRRPNRYHCPWRVLTRMPTSLRSSVCFLIPESTGRIRGLPMPIPRWARFLSSPLEASKRRAHKHDQRNPGNSRDRRTAHPA